jgi:cysteine desulfurase
MGVIYLDNHATTRVDDKVVAEMLPYLTDHYGNPSVSSYEAGRFAKQAVELARVRLSTLIGSQPDEVVFTSGATESINLAIRSVCRQAVPGHIVSAKTEHRAVLETLQDLEAAGWRVTWLTVGEDGLLDPEELRNCIGDQTRLVSIMWANNETGVIQKMAEISKVCSDMKVILHSDATQAVGRVPIDLHEVPIDLVSLSAHKFHGPKGVGALVARRAVRRHMKPLFTGGGQERGLRPGTLPVHQIVGLGAAAELAQQDVEPSKLARLRDLRDRFLFDLRSSCSEVEINGSPFCRLPGNLNLWIRGVDGDALAHRCSDEIALSTGSACSSTSLEPSHVLLEMTKNPIRSSQSVRLGLSRFTSQDEMLNAVRIIGAHVRVLRAMSE